MKSGNNLAISNYEIFFIQAMNVFISLYHLAIDYLIFESEDWGLKDLEKKNSCNPARKKKK